MAVNPLLEEFILANQSELVRRIVEKFESEISNEDEQVINSVKEELIMILEEQIIEDSQD